MPMIPRLTIIPSPSSTAATSFRVANKPGARRIGDDVRNDERRPQAFDIEIQATVNIGVESDRGRVDHDVGFRRNFVSVPLNDELGLSLGLAVEQINKRAASAFAPVHHNSARGTRQCELHPNCPRSAARTKHDDLLPLRIDDLPEGLQESLAVSIFANEFLATANRAVDRADHHRRIAQPVEMFNDRDLMWDRAVEAYPAHSAGAFDSVSELIREHLAIDVSDIKPTMPIRRFHHGDGGVLRRRHRE